jgi:hypothetical protein
MNNLKKYIAGLFLLVIMLMPVAALTPTVASAQTTPCVGTDDASTKKCIDSAFSIQEVQIGDQDAKKTPLAKLSKAVTSKNEFSFSDVFAAIIKIMTGLAVVMTFIGAIVAGVLLLFTDGEEGNQTKAKTILVYVAIGDLIIAASYAIVRGITMIKPLS